MAAKGSVPFPALHAMPSRPRLLVIAFINNLLDGHFPFLKTHRLFLLEFGITRFARRDETKRPYGTHFVIHNSVATVATFLAASVRDKRRVGMTGHFPVFKKRHGRNHTLLL